MGFDVYSDGHAKILSRESFAAIQELVRREAGAFWIEDEARATLRCCTTVSRRVGQYGRLRID